MSNRKMLEMILKRKGLVCDKVEHGQQAVDKVRERGVDHYHLIFMDSVMPVMVSVLQLYDVLQYVLLKSPTRYSAVPMPVVCCVA